MKYDIEHTNNTQSQYETLDLKNNTSCQSNHENATTVSTVPLKKA